MEAGLVPFAETVECNGLQAVADGGELVRPFGILPRIAGDEIKPRLVFTGDDMGLGNHQRRSAAVAFMGRESLLHAAGQGGAAGVGGKVSEQQQRVRIVLELTEVSLDFSLHARRVAALVVEAKVFDARGGGEGIASQAFNDGGFPFGGSPQGAVVTDLQGPGTVMVGMTGEIILQS